MRACICIVTILLATGSTSVVAQTPRRVALHYTRGEGADGCIDPATLAARIEAFTGPVLSTPASADASLEAHVEARRQGGFRAHVRLSHPGRAAHGERVLDHDAADCRTFDDALAFVLATTIDPDLTLDRVDALFGASETPPEAELLDELSTASPVVEALPAAPAPAPVVPATTVAVEPRWGVGLGVSASNELPTFAVGPALALRARLRRWLEVAVAVRAELTPRAATPAQNRRVYAQLYAASWLLCPRQPLAAGTFSVAACAGPEVSMMHARSAGYVADGSGSVVSWAVQLRAELAWRPLSRYDVALAGFGRFTSRRPRLDVEANDVQDRFYRAPAAAFGGELVLRRWF